MAQLPQIDSLRRPNATASAASKPRRFPWLHLPLAIVITLLVGYGLIIVYSAVRADGDYRYSRQLGGVAVGLIFMILVWRFDYRRLSDYTTLFLIINVVLIMSPHIPGLGTDAGMGARSWIKLGMQIQPGEFAKITVILMDAAVMARYGGNLDDPREYVKALGIMMVPFVCIMTQPDLGTGLVYLCIAAFALVMGGANTKYLLITLGLFVAAVVAVFAIDEVIKSSTGEYKLLKQYQRNRLLVFMDQSGTATTDEGYNLQQAKVAAFAETHRVALRFGGVLRGRIRWLLRSWNGHVPDAAAHRRGPFEAQIRRRHHESHQPYDQRHGAGGVPPAWPGVAGSRLGGWHFQHRGQLPGLPQLFEERRCGRPTHHHRRPGHLLREGDLGFRRLSRETACRWLRMFHVKHHLEIQGA